MEIKLSDVNIRHTGCHKQNDDYSLQRVILCRYSKCFESKTLVMKWRDGECWESMQLLSPKGGRVGGYLWLLDNGFATLQVPGG